MPAAAPRSDQHEEATPQAIEHDGEQAMEYGSRTALVSGEGDREPVTQDYQCC